jgi:quinol---cytochrome c reductase iron-sulfur subunit, bacillus type
VSTTHTRRSFYSVLISSLASVMAAALAVPAGIYLLWSAPSKNRSTFVEIADLTQLHVGKPQEVTFERTRVDGWRVLKEKVVAWVVRTDESNVVAYAPQCTHLGCAYHWEEERDRFVCPCHESLFTIEGKVVGGPASRPLDRYAVRVENSKLLVGSKIVKA